MQTNKHRIDGTFYPVQRNELLKLRKLKIINNTAFVYLALKYENPFCNRPIEIQVPEFCLKWGLPESSFYAAVAVLKNREAISICNRVVTIQWAETLENTSPHSQQAEPSRNLESILGSENQFLDPRIDIYNDRARGLESLESLDPPLPPTGELDGGEKSFSITQSEVVLNSLTSMQDQTKATKEAIAMNRDGFSAAGHQGKVCVNASGHQGNVELGANGHTGTIKAEALGHKGKVVSPISTGHSGDITATANGHSGDVTNNFFPIELDKMPKSLLEKAKDLGISFDHEVIGALKEHHQSQFMSALREMEEYTGTIKHPNKFLIKKLPKMPKENLGMLYPVYSSNWLDAPADPLPEDVRQKTWQVLKANSAKNKAKKA